MIQARSRKWIAWVLVAASVVVVLAVNRILVEREIRKGPGLGPAEPIRWEAFSPAAGGFRVNMPGSPSPKIGNKSEWGIDYQISTYTASDGDMAFTVGYYDCPTDPIVDWSTEALILALREKLETNHQGADLVEESVRISNRTGLKVTVAQKGERRISRYLFLPAGHRCYVLVVGGRTSTWNEPLAERFLASFELVGQRPVPGERGAGVFFPEETPDPLTALGLSCAANL